MSRAASGASDDDAAGASGTIRAPGEESSTAPPTRTPASAGDQWLPAFAGDFPGPTIVHDKGSWYAFATESDGIHVQAARADNPGGPWTRLGRQDLMPKFDAGFFTGRNNWAPDVRVLGPERYVLYFSGEVAGTNPARHCVGVATAKTILGPYEPQPKAFECDLEAGSAIDPSTVLVDGRLYMTYKVDGNSVGSGGQCNNGNEPRKRTPIMLQELNATTGIDKIGPAVEILDRAGNEPLVEAPAIYRPTDGTYVLFFSSGCYTDPSYNVLYATAKNIAGPYTRASKALLVTGDHGLVAPGEATPNQDGSVLIFHTDCGKAGSKDRCMHVRKLQHQGGVVSLV